MYWIIDLIVTAIIVLSVILAARQGFVRIAVSVIGFVVAVSLAFAISKPLADVTYQKLIEPPIISAASQTVSENTDEIVNEAWESLPQFVSKNADSMGITKQSLQKIAEQNSENGSKVVMKEISQKAIKPVAVKIIGIVYAVILIIILLILVKFASKFLNKIFSFSVVGKLNQFAGGALGAVRGFFLAVLFSKIVVLVISFTQNGVWIFNNQNIDKTIFFKFLTNVF